MVVYTERYKFYFERLEVGAEITLFEKVNLKIDPAVLPTIDKDWSQSDSLHPDYIKNRPFGEMYVLGAQTAVVFKNGQFEATFILEDIVLGEVYLLEIDGAKLEITFLQDEGGLDFFSYSDLADGNTLVIELKDGGAPNEYILYVAGRPQ